MPIRFGVFELDIRSGQLRCEGRKVKLQEQPFQVLVMLLERPGEVVTREEFTRKLWPNNTFVDYERGLNKAINRLREALRDDADKPRFIETLPHRGYRFIAPVGDGVLASSQVAEQVPLTKSTASGMPRHSDPVEQTIGINHDTSPPNGAVQPQGQTDRQLNLFKIGAEFLFGTVCVAALLLVYLRVRPHVQQTAAVTPIPFTAFPGLEAAPTFSPDGTQVAFAWTGDALKSKGFDLYLKVVGSENLLRLTQHPSQFIYPAWSPDGAQIAFHRISGSDTGLYVVPALGGPERKLRSTHINIETSAIISWSPDGKWIAYSDSLANSRQERVNLLSLETLKSNQLPHPTDCLNEGLPAFSHKGNLLAYNCASKPLEVRTYTVAIEGGTPKLIATFSGWASANAWTGEDSRLVFTVDQGKGNELLELRLANGSLRKLPFGEGVSWPAISRKGDKLVFTVSSNNINIWRKDLLHPGWEGVKLLASTREQTNPNYSPDGKHIAFESTRGGAREIWISDSDGTNLTQISRFNSNVVGTPRWSPDSRKIVFDSWRTGKGEVYVVDLTELIPRRLVTNVSGMFQPSWSHDGKWIYFLSGATDAPRIYRCPANGGNETMLSSEPAFGFHESFDGETIYFVDGWYDARLKKISLNQIGPALPVEGVPLLKDASLWTVDPGGIYFVATAAPHSICYFDFSSRQVLRITDTDRDLNSINGGLAVSPDKRWILYSQVDDISSDIMLVDHFH